MTAYAGEPMRFGSRLFQDYVPAADEELTRRYRAAGLVIFGKTNTPELGVSNVTEPELFGPTRNPWNLERTLERLERRLRGCGRGAHRAGRQCERRRRLDPHAGLELRPRRPEAEPRPQSRPGPQLPDVWWGFIGEHVVTRTVRDSAALLDATCGDYPQQLHEAARTGAAVPRGDAAAARAGCASRFVRSGPRQDAASGEPQGARSHDACARSARARARRGASCRCRRRRSSRAMRR